MTGVAATVSSQGQVTIPAKIREMFGLSAGNRIVFVPDVEKNIVMVRREKDMFESLDEWRANLPPKAKAAMKQGAGKTANELMNEYWASPEGQAELGRLSHGN
jgi:AbrB family looped-hinge helix DNA binding protein